MMLKPNGPYFDEFNPYSEKEANSGRKSEEVRYKTFSNIVESVYVTMLTPF